MPTYHDEIWGQSQKHLRQSMKRAFERARDTVPILLPDTCKIRPATGANPVMSAKGILTTDVPIYRTYRGFEEIPCRGDEVRSFRPDALAAQPTQVDEVDLHLPMDLVIAESDVVEYLGHEYKITKLSNDSAFILTQVAKIMRLGDSLD